MKSYTLPLLETIASRCIIHIDYIYICSGMCVCVYVYTHICIFIYPDRQRVGESW